MRNFGLINAVIGLFFHGAIALPMPKVYPLAIRLDASDHSRKALYPYPIYRTDDAVVFASASSPNIDSRQGRLGMISAVFSQAVDVGFVTVVLRPREHLVSFLRYYNPKERIPSSRTLAAGHSKRTFPSTDPGKVVPYTAVMSPREEPGSPEAFHSHDYRSSKDDVTGERESFPIHDYKRNVEFTRSSTHSTSGEHLKAQEVNDYPPRQPPVHNPQ
ncbi:hypothetical protein FRC12_018413 [Ceratobasidium sp. 428]|nr:hypothetical protein FRC12_018413 [Ceratobasidium sp. 428]